MKCGPLVIVGQARSGSTLLTRLIADTGYFLLVNDAYFLQMADDICKTVPMSEGEALQLAEAVVKRMEERAITENVHTVNRSVPLSEDQFRALKTRLPQIVPQIVAGNASPEAIIGAVLAQAAQLAGARAWGWNSPQDYVHAERLIAAFPDIRILFLIRNPFDVLKSYKNLPAYWGEERNRYHPAVQALVWRTVTREFRRLEALHPGHVRLLRYEDMVAGDGPWQNFGGFLGDIRPRPAASYDRNSSGGRRAGRPLTAIEAALCRTITGADLARLGYEPKAAKGGLGLLDLTATTGRFLGFYARRALTSRDMRQRIRRFGAVHRQSGIGPAS